MSTPSAATVAKALINRATARLSLSRVPMIPEPTTVATRMAVPRNSAVTRRPKSSDIAGSSTRSDVAGINSTGLS